MKNGYKTGLASLLVMFMAVSPSVALAQTGLGEAAVTEITMIIPQATIIGVAVIGVLGVIVAILTIISLLKHI